MRTDNLKLNQYILYRSHKSSSELWLSKIVEKNGGNLILDDVVGFRKDSKLDSRLYLESAIKQWVLESVFDEFPEELLV